MWVSALIMSSRPDVTLSFLLDDGPWQRVLRRGPNHARLMFAWQKCIWSSRTVESLLENLPRCDLSEKRAKERRTGFGGPAISCLYQEEMIREEDKNIFDYCRENNIERVTKAISSNKVEVNAKDEEGRALLHWACDRGHKELVVVLLQNNADINSQDNEGQTALHYASACEFADIVELLLQAGADPSIKDQEGSLPEEVTESKDISSLLRQFAASKG